MAGRAWTTSVSFLYYKVSPTTAIPLLGILNEIIGFFPVPGAGEEPLEAEPGGATDCRPGGGGGGQLEPICSRTGSADLSSLPGPGASFPAVTCCALWALVHVPLKRKIP